MITLTPGTDLSVSETRSREGQIAHDAGRLLKNFDALHPGREVVGVEFSYVPMSDPSGATRSVRVIAHVVHRARASEQPGVIPAAVAPALHAQH